MRRIRSDRCALVVTGHTAAALPRSVMNSPPHFSRDKSEHQNGLN
jgi:hypothetical protein